jgi:hypothetical protein
LVGAIKQKQKLKSALLMSVLKQNNLCVRLL